MDKADKETLEWVIDILKKESTRLSYRIRDCYEAIKAETDREDPDNLLEAIMELRDCETEQAGIRRVCNRFDVYYCEHFKRV